MARRLAAVLVLVFTAWAANIKLYLKDGSFHVVREYKVEADRVRYYSVERSEWEEIPKDLVDLKRTESEAAERQTELERDAKVLSEEEAATRAVEKEVSRIPRDPGVYWLDGKETRTIKAAESTLHTDKRRSVLAKLSPIPAVTGKATIEIQGLHSQNIFTDPGQEFYIQLSETERFGMIKLTPKGTVRIAENVTIVPISKEVEEEPIMVETLQQQLDEGLYKIWPKDPLPPGEYAVVEYTANKMNMQIWDFAIKAK